METIEELEAELARYEAAYRAGQLTDAMFALRFPSADAADSCGWWCLACEPLFHRAFGGTRNESAGHAPTTNKPPPMAGT